MVPKLSFYNTLARQIEEFQPLNPPNVGMYSCGPTVYDYVHVGHFRSYVFVDTLKRVLIYNGFKVKHVMNLTDVGHLTEYDVEEQMRKRGGQGTVWEMAEFYAQDFFAAMKKLNVLPADIVCKASEHIEDQIRLIKILDKKGFTYQIDDGIYFDISKFAGYGNLGRLKLDGQEPGARVDVNIQKRNPYDFALWKFSQPEEKRAMEWESPWAPPGVRGKARGVPGWHIECSAMAMKYLGDGEQSRTIDIHTGGEDLIPIHHTNEIAQSEAATGKPFVRYWLHNAHLIVEGEKMSRSKGNIYTLVDLEKRGFDPLALRYLFLTVHYRQKMNFTWEGLRAAQVAFGKLANLVSEWRRGGREVVSTVDVEKNDNLRRMFQEKIGSDLDTPGAITVVWQVAKSNLPDPDKLDLIFDFDQVLGLDLVRVSSLDSARDKRVPREVEELVIRREELRKQENWEEADVIRKEIEKLGFVIEDTSEGSKIKRKT